jgi:hypothetical protein
MPKYKIALHYTTLQTVLEPHQLAACDMDEPSSCPYPEPNESSPYHPIISL